jgi:hypothetical protein
MKILRNWRELRGQKFDRMAKTGRIISISYCIYIKKSFIGLIPATEAPDAETAAGTNSG